MDQFNALLSQTIDSTLGMYSTTQCLLIQRDAPFFDVPTHITVCSVRHTVVSCFYTLRCVASYFQPSIRDTSPLFYCRIPSYRVNREFLFRHMITKDSQGSSHLLLHCTIQSLPIDNPSLGYYDLCRLLPTSFTPS